MQIDPTTIPQSEVYKHIAFAVAPRPIAFASTIDKVGNVNLSPFSFFNLFSSNPPVLIFSPVRSGRDGSTKHTLQNVLEVPEVSISIVNYAMVEQMSLASTAYAKGVNEFVKAGFTAAESSKIKAPFVTESPASFECVVDQVIELGQEGGAGNLVVARVVNMHLRDEYLDENGYLDTHKLDLVGRMGGSYYSRANNGLFEIPKPIRTQGIGVDQLPISVRNSSVLTGNNLGRLGNAESLPDADLVEQMGRIYLSKSIEEIHQVAQQLLEQGQTEKALALLLSADR
ncbi:MAG: flavin reductase family protein [Saprospiraceae bacterium]